ncbi:MAG: VCBS repeat-containing protein [Kouleothrix sp.]
MVDVDGDGRPDMVFTRRQAAPAYRRNTGDPAARFVRHCCRMWRARPMPMAWGDLDGDGALDLVAGPYDAELLDEPGMSFLLGPGAGAWRPTPAAARGSRPRCWQSNRRQAGDYAVRPERRWPARYRDRQRLRDTRHVLAAARQRLAAAELLPRHQLAAPWASTRAISITRATMRCSPAMYEALRYQRASLARWQPMMRAMWSPPVPGDRQIVENVLQVRGADGQLLNQAYDRGVDATGWSWSGVFGDLDNDGWLDLYVVNGIS